MPGHEASKNFQAALSRAAQVLLPPPDITISQWAERFRVLVKGTTPRPGRWVSETYQREIMDSLCDPEVHEVVFMKSTQVGYSEMLNNVVGYYIDLDPSPIMLVQPTDTAAEEYGRKRITPMIEACPSIREKVREAKARKGGNTLKLKEFPGGFLKLVGANAGSGLRSDPVPRLLFDEVDGYPSDVQGEGDPIDIATRRTDGYADYKVFKGSTPAKAKGFSRIEIAFERSDKRRFHVPCPHCGHLQPLWWRDPVDETFRLAFDRDHEGNVAKESVRYVCASCQKGIQERYKQQMLDGGRWIAECPGRPVVGFHINALYSPWKDNWATLAQEWIDAQDNPEALRAFINLRLGETFEEAGDVANASALMARREAMSHPVAENAAVLTCSADVQGNRIEAIIKAWGPGEESWLVDRKIFWGDPGADSEPWDQLDEFRMSEYLRADGVPMRPQITLVDSGDGNKVDAVYDWVMPRQRERVFACKGRDILSRPVLVEESVIKKSNLRMYSVATHAAKDRIFSRLKIAEPGAGYMHFPEWADEEYFAQLTGEKKLVLRDKRTRAKKIVWVKTHTRNEALDLEVYAMSGLFVLQTYLAPATFRDLAATLEMTKGNGGIPTRQRRILSSLSR